MSGPMIYRGKMKEKIVLVVGFSALLLSLFSGLSFSMVVKPSFLESITQVGGVISEDTTWSDGHYIVTAHILVPEGITLIIEPGVEVSLEDHFLQVDGTLRAIGTENERIIITGSGASYDDRLGRITFTETSMKWNKYNGTGCILEYCDFSSIDGVINIHSGAFPKISNCIIKGTDDAIWAYGGLIVNNTISNNGRGIVIFSRWLGAPEPFLETKLFIIDNIISKNGLGIYVTQGLGGYFYCGSPIIKRNIISNNRGEGGVRIDGSTPEIKNNTIYNNSPYGIIIIGFKTTNLSFNYNNIYKNSDYNVFLCDTEVDINASYNWWGTTDIQAIEAKLYDYTQDFRLGHILYEPFLTEPTADLLDNVSPVTIDDYDNEWHVTDFTITLTPSDHESGVAKTYYRINDGSIKTISSDGQPYITTEGANNTLEYWSLDKAGNEELPHKILTGIKLDKTPPKANAGADQTVNEGTLVAFDGSASWDENGITRYTWTFTDLTPQTLSGKNPTYTFATPGTYTITLKVTDAAGNTDTHSITITVEAVPAEAFPLWIVGVAVATIAIATAAIAVFWRRRKQPPTKPDA